MHDRIKTKVVVVILLSAPLPPPTPIPTPAIRGDGKAGSSQKGLGDRLEQEEQKSLEVRAGWDPSPEVTSRQGTPTEAPRGALWIRSPGEEPAVCTP